MFGQPAGTVGGIVGRLFRRLGRVLAVLLHCLLDFGAYLLGVFGGFLQPFLVGIDGLLTLLAVAARKHAAYFAGTGTDSASGELYRAA